jgi:3-deoxy-manno-octulosonate cytidylyltransferase (CMP-KDO synthetase)
MNKLIIIIPARYGSTRFEGKPLAPICGRPLIRHVYEKAKMAELADLVIIATDDERIAEAVKNFGGTAMMTSALHETGTDRIIEAAQHIDCQWIINLQGDEPLIEPKAIDLLAREMRELPGENMFSLMRPVSEAEEFLNPNMVKVVTDHKDYALYFSRAPIPCPKGGFPKGPDFSKISSINPFVIQNAYIHCGIYGYRKDFLLSIPQMKQSFLEKIESLEQLRVLSNGYKIKMIKTEYRSIGVDTPEDIKLVEQRMKQ